MNFKKIEKELESFKYSSKMRALPMSKQLMYAGIMRHLLESEQLPVTEIVRRARFIKPLVRLQNENNGKDVLVWIKLCDVTASFYHNFVREDIVRQKGTREFLSTGKLEKVAEFTCYSRCNSGLLVQPSAVDVLQQLPSGLNLKGSKQYAFELICELPKSQALSEAPKQGSFYLPESYDEVLNCFVIKVVLYEAIKGLPRQIANTPVVYANKTYYA